jgi:hypothetical protein
MVSHGCFSAIALDQISCSSMLCTYNFRMGFVPHKLLALVLAFGLIVAGPACAHAQMDPCGSTASHKVQAVQHYADLNIDPDDGASSEQTMPVAVDHQQDGLCKKCCATCVGTSLLPAAPVAVLILTASKQIAQIPSIGLAARPVPTEPEIPKAL